MTASPPPGSGRDPEENGTPPDDLRSAENDSPQNGTAQNETAEHESTEHERMTEHDPQGGRTPDQEMPPTEEAAAEADGLSSAEEVLRRLLHDSVQGIEPSSGALDHLHRAVPARRAHRRQALVGLAACLLLAVAAVPALIHTAGSSGHSADTASSTDNHHPAGRGLGDHGSHPTHRPAGGGSGSGHSKGKGKGSGTGGQGHSHASTGPSTSPSDGTMDAMSTTCTTEQLSASPEVGQAGGDGKVYGSFTVSNISQQSCSIGSPGTVTAVPQGSAEGSRVSAAQHSAGDPATALPDGGASTVVLSPGDSFKVRFGWVPASGTTGCGTPTQPASSAGSTDGGDGSNTDSGQPSGSVSITYTTDGATATSTTTVPNTCAGTVYYTGLLTE